MIKLVTAASATALLLASSFAAFAEEATGAITAVDPAAGTVTLADGQTFSLPMSIDAAALQVGQEVTIMYDQGSDGTMTATAVEPAN